MIKKIFIAIIVALMALVSVSASASELTDQAEREYRNDEYKAALRDFERAAKEEGVSPELLYNIGNTYYRLNNPAMAIVYYERALKLDPSFDDARANLKFVNTTIVDKPEVTDSSLELLNNNVASKMSPNSWAIFALALFIATLALVVLYLLSGKVALRKLGFFGGIVLLFAFGYTLFMAWRTSAGYYDDTRAVIMRPSVDLLSEPGKKESGEKLPTLHAGTVVEVLDSMSIKDHDHTPVWYKVKVNNGVQAWVNKDDVVKI